MEADDMTISPDLWRAIYQLADAWSETPIVRKVAEALPRNRPLEDRSDGATGVPAFLHHMDLTVGGLMHPLMYGSRIPVLMHDPMIAGAGMPTVGEPELTEWLQNAGRIENAHRRTLGWLRSSLAGYPILRAPQLAPGSPLTTLEITRHFIWPKEEFAAGLNRLIAPPEVAELLGADGPRRSALDRASQDVAAELAKSSAWTRFADAARALDDEAKAELRQARHDLSARLTEEHVDEHEEKRVLPRSEYREHTTADVIEALDGPARSYADAFADVHALLTMTACDIFGELALYGEPWPVPVLNVEAPEPGQPVVEFETAGAAGFFLDADQVVWLDSQTITDAVRIERKTFTMNIAQGSRDLFTGRVLQGTAQGWPASSVPIPTPPT